METALRVIQKELLQLRQSIDSASLGHLSVLLVPPQKLSEILQEVSKQLPSDLSLLTSTEIDNVYIYYQIAKTRAISTSEGIRLFIEVPLKTESRHFELYNIKPLPYFNKDIKMFISLNAEAEYIMVSEDRQTFVLPDKNYLSKCQQGPYTICPADLPLSKSESSCAISAFIGNNRTSSLCKKLIYPDNYEPIIYRSMDKSFWIYSISDPVRITWKCMPANMTSVRDKFNIIKTELIHDTGLLNQSSRCTIHSNKFVLLPNLSGSSFHYYSRTPIHIPEIPDILEEDDKEKFKNDLSNDETRLKLRNYVSQLQKNYKPIDFSSVIVEFSKIENRKRNIPNNDYTYKIIGLISCILIIILLWKFKESIFNFCKFCSGNKVRKNSYVTREPIAQPSFIERLLSKSDREFQPVPVTREVRTQEFELKDVRPTTRPPTAGARTLSSSASTTPLSK